MKKLFSILAFVMVGLASAATPGDIPVLRSKNPIILPSEASKVYDPTGYMIADKIYDDTLPAGNATRMGPVIDIRNLQLDRYTYKDTIINTDSTLGTISLSCYDVNDSASVTDSISVKAWVWGYDYASDNVNPLAPFGPTAFLAGDSTGILAALSASNARKDTTYRFILKTQAAKATRFIRMEFRNISTAAQNRPRCRAWLFRKRAKIPGN